VTDIVGRAPLAQGPALPDSGVVARGVRRTFGSVEAVRGIDLTAAPGEVTALVGPNGAGKTTLLLVLATLLVPDAGDVRVAGHDPVTEPDAVRARMGWSPDVFGLYDTLTAAEYLEFVGRGLPDEAPQAPRAGARAARAHRPARTGPTAGAHHVPRPEAAARARPARSCTSPEVLLLDEPASGLDPRSRVELRDLLRSFARAGTAVLVSSHLLGDLEELADRVVFVDRGRPSGEHRLDALPSARPAPLAGAGARQPRCRRARARRHDTHDRTRRCRRPAGHDERPPAARRAGGARGPRRRLPAARRGARGTYLSLTEPGR
jgi:ABC-2 type transport system ATP-binding protein